MIINIYISELGLQYMGISKNYSGMVQIFSLSILFKEKVIQKLVEDQQVIL